MARTMKPTPDLRVCNKSLLQWGDLSPATRKPHSAQSQKGLPHLAIMIFTTKSGERLQPHRAAKRLKSHPGLPALTLAVHEGTTQRILPYDCSQALWGPWMICATLCASDRSTLSVHSLGQGLRLLPLAWPYSSARFQAGTYHNGSLPIRI